jgi:hypothetical protein
MLQTMRNHSKKIICALLLLAFIVPAIAHAEDPPSFRPTSCIPIYGDATSCAIFGITVVVGYITDFFVVLGAFLAGLALEMSSNIVNNGFVQSGFKSVLLIANLGFVLGILYIAISTMLRRQSYDMKKILFRLILMAVLVNFGLVFCGVILNLSDQFTAFFLKQSNAGAFSDFPYQISRALAPQSLFPGSKLRQKYA